jgi:hypothetical protein
LSSVPTDFVVVIVEDVSEDAMVVVVVVVELVEVS